MQDQDDINFAEAEIERVLRHVNAVRERIRVMNQSVVANEDSNSANSHSF